MVNNRPLVVARARLKAYVDKDVRAIESLLDVNFHFCSPIDNQLDRDTYLLRCWPNNEKMEQFNEVYSAEIGDQAIIVYEAKAASHRFRNCEVSTVRGGKIVGVEVYFGWVLPHVAPLNGFVDNDGRGHA